MVSRCVFLFVFAAIMVPRLEAQPLPPPVVGGAVNLEATVGAETRSGQYDYQPPKPYVILAEQVHRSRQPHLIRTPVPGAAGSVTATFVLDPDYAANHPGIVRPARGVRFDYYQSSSRYRRITLTTKWDDQGAMTFSLDAAAEVGPGSFHIEGRGRGHVFGSGAPSNSPNPRFHVDEVTKVEGKVSWFSWGPGFTYRHLSGIGNYWTEAQSDGTVAVFHTHYYTEPVPGIGEFYPIGAVTTTGAAGRPPGYEIAVEPLTAPQAYEVLRTEGWAFAGDYQSQVEPVAHYAFTPGGASASKLRYKLQIQPGLARVITWAETFTPEGAGEPSDYKFLSEEVTAAATETQSHDIDPFARFGSQPGIYRVLAFETDSFDATLTADTNRDGALLPAGGPLTDYVLTHADTATAARPYGLLFNTDDDDGDGLADSADGNVNGANDLADFFPVLLNIKQLLVALPPSVVCKLSQADAALNFVYTDLTQATAFTYLTDTRDNGYGPAFDQAAASATVQSITAAGVELSPDFLNRIRNQGQGVILIEARQASTKPLVLTVETGTGTATVSLPLQTIGASLAVDANRDGTIKLASEDTSDATSASQPFRFWINDDDDSGGDINGDDTPSAAEPDGQQVKVQGTRDLVDFFPVFLDLKPLLTVLPPDAQTKYKLKQANEALRFVYTDLARADAFKYLKDSAIGNSLKEADAHWVTAVSYELDATWLGQVKDADKGVILVEGRGVTDKPLVLSVEKADGTVITEVKLELKIVPVETMFRHLNLHDRNLAGLVGTKEDSAQPEAMGDPTGFPDNPNSDSRWLIFVHGFNVSGQKSRGWNAEMFKRTYWSGNKSRFVGVSWFGNPDPGSLGLPADYHLSMRNAMVTAPVLAQAINALPGNAGTKTMFAHSLGCGVISSAIADHGMTVGRVCFVDAALARECFDGRDPSTFTVENDGMTPAVWKPYSPGLYAANWFARFDPTTDARGKLTWSNRFSGASSNVYHFYSSTEDVLAEYTGELPSTLGGIAWDSGLHGSFGWVYQEKGKGNRQNYGLGGPPLTHLGSYYGGWGMNIKDPVLSGDAPYWKWVSSDSFIGRMVKTPAEIGIVSDSVLGRHPVFEPGWGVVRNQEQQENPVSNVSPVDGAPSWIYDLYLGTTGNTLAANSDNRAQLLAEAIPSLTWCMGSRPVTRFEDRNFNLPSLVDQTNWPRGKPDGTTPEWRHSDMREVAYLYQYGVFDKIVVLSKP